MTRTRILTALVLTASAALLVGCGGNAATQEAKVDTSNARNIATALKDAGFVCVSYEENKQAIGPTSSGTCMHEGRSIGISTFNSEEDRKRITEQAARAFGEDGTPSGKTSVASGNWVITTTAGVDAQRIQEILGGERQ